MTPRLLIEPARLAGRPLLRLQSDERLVDLVRAGNDRAFEAIVDRYHRPLLRYCGRLMPRGRVEDVVQQALLNAFAALRRDEAKIDLRPWLYRIAHNAALNALRDNGWSHEDVEAVAAAHEGPHEVAERRDDLRSVLEAMQTLPARQRAAMILRELEGRTYAQIADELQVTGGAVRQLLNRARNKLRAGATALTPLAALTRLTLAGGQQVLGTVASHEPLRSGAARMAGTLLAGMAVLVGLSDVVGQRPSSPAAAPSARQPVGTGAPGPVVPVGDGGVAHLPAALAHAVGDAMASVLKYPAPARLGERPESGWLAANGGGLAVAPKLPSASGSAGSGSSGQDTSVSRAPEQQANSGLVGGVVNDGLRGPEVPPAPAPAGDPVASVATAAPEPAPAALAPAAAKPTLATTSDSSAEPAATEAPALAS